MRVAIVLLFAALSFAQTAPSAAKPASPQPATQSPSSTAAKPAGATAATSTNPNLPSEQTVQEFMRHMFGYDPTLKWQVSRIASNDSGLAEVMLVVTNAQNQQQSLRLYVTPN